MRHGIRHIIGVPASPSGGRPVQTCPLDDLPPSPLLVLTPSRGTEIHKSTAGQRAVRITLECCLVV